MISNNCIKCGRTLTADEKALFKKMVRRSAEEFWCISCMSEHFKLDEEVLYKQIELFRKAGCSLF